MRILLIGAAGTLGSALHTALSERGHTLITVGRSSGELRLDVTDPEHVAQMYAQAGAVDAVVGAAGEVPFKPLGEMTAEDYAAGFHGKVLSQISLVRQGLDHVAVDGSFTLVSGIIGRAPIRTGSAAAMANGAVEHFVRAAAAEIAPRRINAVSPTVFTESLAELGDYFPGFPSVDLAEVANAFIRSIEGVETGRVFEL
jgi:NAD(P)-dependent dehydrogenase (short-subunit alcohol dehydrogenase family)